MIREMQARRAARREPAPKKVRRTRKERIEQKEEHEEPKKKGRPFEVDTSPFQELYDLGYTDKMISLKCGVSVSPVRQWRKANNRPPNYDPEKTKTIFSKLRRMQRVNYVSIHPDLKRALGWRVDDKLKLEIIGDVLQISKVSK